MSYVGSWQIRGLPSQTLSQGASDRCSFASVLCPYWPMWYCTNPFHFTGSPAHDKSKCENNTVFLQATTVFTFSRMIAASATVRETISKLLCTVQNRQNKTLIIKNTHTEMSQTWATRYCEWTKKIVKSLAEQTWVYNGENIVLSLGPTQGICKFVLQRRPNSRLNGCLSNFRTIWYT